MPLCAGLAHPRLGLAAKSGDEAFEPIGRDIDKPAFIQIGKADAARFPQSFQLRSLVSLSLFDQAQSLAHNFAGVLVAPGLHQPVDDSFMVLGENDIACRHE
ncbi:hypothetical protein AGR7C_Lc130039 [Agrobacterium deltaense Zutra 3/1]|uniref:Uncharacterized protein n=1 Tax=Agrobacterium deltaense Zutra 3/1 TaxID=1183427 RepID=A0A1S7R7D9_9HYPH|nr:hypothetical protein AGR7C_Lc130039 [Agrobacterium deltaense Zutra 3/1]